MATSIVSNNQGHPNHNGHGTLRFLLLDSDVIAESISRGQQGQTKLTMSNATEQFQKQEECQKYIEQHSNYRLVLITSGSAGRKFVPIIHQLPQVTSIYVFCMDQTTHKKWACDYSKVKAVTSSRQDLFIQIQQDQKSWLIKPRNVRMQTQESLLYQTFTTDDKDGSSTTGINGKFIYFQVLIGCLMRLESSKTDQKELISHCQNQHQHDYIELARISEFQKDYKPETALWWYTRDSFVYRTLNTALRCQDIHMLFLFRSFICDVHSCLKHLNTHQSKEKFCVYRSQLMSKAEVKILEKSTDQFISVNSLLSTSNQRETALFFLGSSQPMNNLQRVLFEISVDPKKIHGQSSTAFADISKYSVFNDEGEVLFMLGSIFRLKSVRLHDGQTWIIHMKLCSNDEHDLKGVLTYMQQQNGRGPTNLRTLGNLLWMMGELSLADKYYRRLVDQLPHNEFWLHDLYDDLMKISSQKHDYDESLRWQKKLYELKNKISSDHNDKQSESTESLMN